MNHAITYYTREENTMEPSKIVILIVGIIMIIIVAALSLIIPQIMIKGVAKRVSKYKLEPGVDVEQQEVTIIKKICKSYEEGRVNSIRKADDCQFVYLVNGEEKTIDVPYGIYLAVDDEIEGTLYLQNGEYRNFIFKEIQSSDAK